MNKNPALQDRVLLNDRAMISTAHYYRQKAWSNEKNASEFGACFTEFGHGHNYEISLTLSVASQDLSQTLRSDPAAQVAKPLDHIHLNFDCKEFLGDTIVPTTEAIATWLWKRAHSSLAKDLVPMGLRLYEMPDLFVDIGQPIEAQIDAAIPNQKRSFVQLKVPGWIQCELSMDFNESEASRLKVVQALSEWDENSFDRVLKSIRTKVRRQKLAPFALKNRRGRYFLFSDLDSL